MYYYVSMWKLVTKCHAAEECTTPFWTGLADPASCHVQLNSTFADASLLITILPAGESLRLTAIS